MYYAEGAKKMSHATWSYTLKAASVQNQSVALTSAKKLLIYKLK